MPFHVEVSSPLHHARVFNLDENELQQVLRFWMAGQSFELGEQEWEPHESKLKILEGKRLEGPDLAFGQGWSNALRSARDATGEMLAAAEAESPLPPVFEVGASSLDEAIVEMASNGEPRPIEWTQARDRIDGRDPAVAAVILVVKQPGVDRRQS